MAAEIRRHQTTLICSGFAVIAFGAWSIVRAFLAVWFNLPLIRETVANEMTGEEFFLSVNTTMVISIVAVFAMLVLDLVFRLYVGLSAVAEGSGKKRRRIYVVLAFLFLAVSAFTQIRVFIVSFREEPSVDLFVTLFIEISSNIAFFEIIRSAHAIRRLARSGNTEQGETYAA